jgi:MerR family transcriptional regulator, light-induced transcriptional regulator
MSVAQLQRTGSCLPYRTTWAWAPKLPVSLKNMHDGGMNSEDADEQEHAQPIVPLESALDAKARYRSGVVARMVRMPVATLRIWEHRYRVTKPIMLAPSGHRLYTAADVHHIALLKQLTDLGHAIGELAALDMQQLRQVAAMHVAIGAIAQPAPDLPPQAWRVAVVGDGLLHRLRSDALRRHLARPLNVVALYGNLYEAALAHECQHAQALLVQAAGLHIDWLPQLQQAQRLHEAQHVAVCYGYTAESARRRFEAAGVVLVHGVATNMRIADALNRMMSADGADAADDDRTGFATAGGEVAGNIAMALAPSERRAAKSGSGSTHVHVDDRAAAPPMAITGSAPHQAAAVARPGPAEVAIADFAPLLNRTLVPKRYSDPTLLDFAALSSIVGCECPKHIAELLMRLSAFETYSEECVQRTREDAQMHRYLRQVAGVARMLFESALERVAVHEGLMPAA